MASVCATGPIPGTATVASRCDFCAKAFSSPAVRRYCSASSSVSSATWKGVCLGAAGDGGGGGGGGVRTCSSSEWVIGQRDSSMRPL